MSREEQIDLFERINAGLEESFENLLRRKAALNQDMVFSDGNGNPYTVPAKQALEDYLKKNKA